MLPCLKSHLAAKASAARGQRQESQYFHGAQNARPTIGLFAGCVGSVFCDKINRQAIDLMTACGVDVATPPSQQCCGAMHQHGGDLDRARKLARQNIDVFLPRKGKQVDFIATPIAVLRDAEGICLSIAGRSRICPAGKGFRLARWRHQPDPYQPAASAHESSRAADCGVSRGLPSRSLRRKSAAR